jgi:hypothetical protein
MRQPQARNDGGASDSPVIKKVRLVRANAAPGPSCGYIVNRPRRSRGAYSAASSAAPPHSPPTASPCTNRRATRMIGAATPIVAALGNRPTATVDAPIDVSVRISVRLRPSRSPRCPKSTAPSGRARNATANVAMAATVPAAAPSAGKKTFPNTSAAAVP